MELKRIYHKERVAEYRAAKEAAVKSLMSNAIPEDVARQVLSLTYPAISPDAVRGVVVRRADKGAQLLTQKRIDQGLREGWLSMAKRKLTIETLEGPNLDYSILFTPGKYCLHCNANVGGVGPDNAEAIRHVARSHARLGSPDPTSPRGFRQINGYMLIRDGEEIENRTPEERLQTFLAFRSARIKRLGERYRPKLVREMEASVPANYALGRAIEFGFRVDNNDPTNAVFVIMAIVSTDTDNDLRDADTFAAILALGNTAEATNTNYVRQTQDDGDLSALSPDDANERFDMDVPDVSFEADAGDNWTDLVWGYDSDSAGGTDANVVPIGIFDFPVTPDGSTITAQINANGLYRAAAA